MAAVVAALWFFTARDDATTNAPATAAAPGQPLAADSPVAAPFAADLRRGNVVLLARRDALAGARAFAVDVAGPPERSVREAGQAVLVRTAPLQRTGSGIVALAEGRTTTATGPEDPALRAFVEYWLGRAAG